MDVHGAESVWRKWLRVPELYEADALLLCGDLTGKSLVPLINRGSGKWNAYYFGRNWTLQEGSELDAMEKRIMDSGSYTSLRARRSERAAERPHRSGKADDGHDQGQNGPLDGDAH